MQDRREREVLGTITGLATSRWPVWAISALDSLTTFNCMIIAGGY